MADPKCVLIKQKDLDDLNAPIEELKQKAFDECKLKYQKMLNDYNEEAIKLRATITHLKEEVRILTNRPPVIKVDPMEMRIAIVHTQLTDNPYDTLGRRYGSYSTTFHPIETFNVKLDQNLRKQITRMRDSLSKYFIDLTKINQEKVRESERQIICNMSYIERRRMLSKYKK